jgi:hypothetical protein
MLARKMEHIYCQSDFSESRVLVFADMLCQLAIVIEENMVRHMSVDSANLFDEFLERDKV